MPRYLVTFNDGVHEADSPERAVEVAAEEDSLPIAAVVYVIDLDALEQHTNGGEGIIGLYRLGGHRVFREETA